MDQITDQVLPGAFVKSLQRNNAKIKADRAASIGEDAETLYKRKVEDLRLKIKKLSRDRDNMLDLSPAETTSLKLALDFDGSKFVQDDMDLTLKIRDLTIELEAAEQRYNYLFTEIVKS